jgi:phospholipid/cholesterol/gamma-HCH transport system substrate-binding protein
METRANYVIVGLLTLAVIAGGFGFVYWFRNSVGTGAQNFYRVVFGGPISGLRTGSAVTFNGIRVGSVTALAVDPADPRRSLAIIAVEPATPIRADTGVTLAFQGLTGIATLALKGGSPTAAALVADGEGMPTLNASSAATADVMQSARDVLVRLESFLGQNEDALKSSIRNIETFTAALARNSDRLDHVMAGLQSVVGDGDGTGDIPEAARAIRNAADNLDKRIETLTTEGRRTLYTLDRTIKNIDRNPSRLIFGGGTPAFPEKKASR